MQVRAAEALHPGMGRCHDARPHARPLSYRDPYYVGAGLHMQAMAMEVERPVCKY